MSVTSSDTRSSELSRSAKLRDYLTTRTRETYIAVFALVGIVIDILIRFIPSLYEYRGVPALIVLVVAGAPLVYELTVKLVRREFGSDLLAGLSIVTSLLVGEYLAGALVVLMLSGGEALESYAVRKASSVLEALAKRMPYTAHRKSEKGVQDVSLNDLRIGDLIVVYPHEICPVDGVVVEGHSVMDESFLTGEPFEISKTPGSDVISGAINGHSNITIRATKVAEDSRYARIAKVMREAEQNRPKLRRMGDQLGALYTPFAIAVAIAAWVMSGDSDRFLAVLVIATPCPLLIAIPVAIIGSISLAARRGIIIKDPAVLEQVENCRTIIFDKTGTLTYGQPTLTDIHCGTGFEQRDILSLTASLERYSKHPLSSAIIKRAKQEKLELLQAAEISERPGEGLRGIVSGKRIEVTNRAKATARNSAIGDEIPPQKAGLECVVLVEGAYAATFRFHDAPRRESKPFIRHLRPRHQFDRVMLVSGDRESEVRYLAEQVGIEEVHAEVSPEGKVEIVRAETARAKTLFLGDGINDAPALMAATVGIAFGQQSDITSEAARAVIMDASLARVDEFFHISNRMRAIALQSAIGGMLLSIFGMGFAAVGLLPPVAGAIMQEFIDLAAVLNALRAAQRPKELSDFS